MLKAVGLELIGREVHLEDVRQVDPVFVDVGDPKVGPHVRPAMMLGRPLPPESDASHVRDARPNPSVRQRRQAETWLIIGREPVCLVTKSKQLHPGSALQSALAYKRILLP